jgi:hypothetical protein
MLAEYLGTVLNMGGSSYRHLQLLHTNLKSSKVRASTVFGNLQRIAVQKAFVDYKETLKYAVY